MFLRMNIIYGLWIDVCGTYYGSTRGGDQLLGRSYGIKKSFLLFTFFGISYFIFQLHSPSQESFSHQSLGISFCLWITSLFFLLSFWDWMVEQEWEWCQRKCMDFRLFSDPPFLCFCLIIALSIRLTLFIFESYSVPSIDILYSHYITCSIHIC